MTLLPKSCITFAEILPSLLNIQFTELETHLRQHDKGEVKLVEHETLDAADAGLEEIQNFHRLQAEPLFPDEVGLGQMLHLVPFAAAIHSAHPATLLYVLGMNSWNTWCLHILPRLHRDHDAVVGMQDVSSLA